MLEYIKKNYQCQLNPFRLGKKAHRTSGIETKCQSDKRISDCVLFGHGVRGPITMFSEVLPPSLRRWGGTYWRLFLVECHQRKTQSCLGQTKARLFSFSKLGCYWRRHAAKQSARRDSAAEARVPAWVWFLTLTIHDKFSVSSVINIIG